MAVMDDKEGEWSETVMLQTKESLGIDTQSVASCGTLMAKEKLILFDKAGTATTTYGYSFGVHFWKIIVLLEEGLNLHNQDLSGIMVVGVNYKKFNSTKTIGSVLNYTLTGKPIEIRILLDINKHTMTVFSPSKPEGENFADLPKDGTFFPIIQNKTTSSKINATNKLKVKYNFDLEVP
jgi:hypothetical protein